MEQRSGRQLDVVGPAQLDPLLEPLFLAESQAARDCEIERLVMTVAQPLAERILSRYTRSERMISRVDAEDIIATVNLRVLRKLRAVTESEEEWVRQLTEYVATLTYNTINDHLRRRHPERVRLQNRLRYVLTHDWRLALWNTPTGVAGGLAASRGSEDALPALPLRHTDLTPGMLDAKHRANALVAIFESLGRPLLFRALVDHVATLWKVEDDASPAAIGGPARSGSVEAARFETRDFLRALWREIGQLPPRQRTALLLNLRDSETINVIALLVFTGTAKFDDIAATLEMSRESLAGLWNDLPLDDLRIGELLNITRQQVINLRKAARERLARRMIRT